MDEKNSKSTVMKQLIDHNINKNFGLTDPIVRADDISDENYDQLFGFSKAEQRLKQARKQAEIERMQAETAAMKKMLEHSPTTETSKKSNHSILIIGSIILLSVIGAAIVLKHKKVKIPTPSEISA